ncbi:MAG: DUF1868 domain-containing protein [Allorhizobium sp.]
MHAMTEQEMVEGFCEDGKDRAPPKVGTRVTPSGHFAPIAGNTVIRHVPATSATMLLLTEAQGVLKSAPFGEHFAYLPPASFHMTVFEGVIDDRREIHHWPEDVSYSAPIKETTALHLERLSTFEAPAPFSMKVKTVTPLGLVLEGATPADDALARAWRDGLTVPFGYKSPNHDQYGFHITLAYCVTWLPREAAAGHLALVSALLERIAHELPVLELNPPAFCRFADLTRFEEIRTL